MLHIHHNYTHAFPFSFVMHLSSLTFPLSISKENFQMIVHSRHHVKIGHSLMTVY
jgi:hypothetical protein